MTALPDGFQTNFLTGFAVLLAAGGIGAKWSPSTPYDKLDTGIIFGAIPPAPDRLITLTSYGVSDDSALSNSVLGLQTRCRWGGQDIRPVNDLQDGIFSLLHGMKGVRLSTGVFVVVCSRLNASPLGQDENYRWSNIANYYVTVHRPSANRT